MKYSKSDLTHLQKDELVEKVLKLQIHVDHLNAKLQKPDEELLELRQSFIKLKAQLHESIQREGILVMRLTMKEQEVQELLAQIQEVKQSQNRGSTQLRASILDPAVNLMYRQMQKEIDNYKAKLQQAQGDIAALKFTPESQTGKRLVAKCHSLMVENEEIGRMLSSGSIAKLEGELALEKQLVKFSRKSEESCEKYMYEVDSELEGMQAAIIEYQVNLKQCQDRLKVVLDKNHELKSLLKAKTFVNDQSGKKDSKDNPDGEVRHEARHVAASGTGDPKKKHPDKTAPKSTGSKPIAPTQDGPHQPRGQARSGSHPKNELTSSTNSDRSKKNQESSGSRHASGQVDKRTKKYPDDRYDVSDKTSSKNKQSVCKNETTSDGFKSRKRNFENCVGADEKSDERKSKRHHFSSEDHDRTKPNVSDVSNGPKSDSTIHLVVKK